MTFKVLSTIAAISVLGFAGISTATTKPPTTPPGCEASGGTPKKCDTPPATGGDSTSNSEATGVGVGIGVGVADSESNSNSSSDADATAQQQQGQQQGQITDVDNTNVNAAEFDNQDSFLGINGQQQGIEDSGNSSNLNLNGQSLENNLSEFGNSASFSSVTAPVSVGTGEGAFSPSASVEFMPEVSSLSVSSSTASPLSINDNRSFSDSSSFSGNSTNVEILQGQSNH